MACYDINIIFMRYITSTDILVKKQQKLKSPTRSHSGLSSTSHSGLSTPSGLSTLSGLTTSVGKTVSGNNSTRSVAYYYKELKKYILSPEANNNIDRFGITITKYICQIYDGKDSVYQVAVDPKDSKSIRNLYLMFNASNYSILNFLTNF
jgi:hypothetical protein